MMVNKKRNFMVTALGSLMVIGSLMAPVSASASTTAIDKDLVQGQLAELNLESENEFIVIDGDFSENDILNFDSVDEDIVILAADDDAKNSTVLEKVDFALLERQLESTESVEVLDGELILPANSEVLTGQDLGDLLKGFFTKLSK